MTCFLSTAMFCTSVYFSRPGSPWRAPTPEFLTPPDGVALAANAVARMSLMLTLPDSIRAATARAASMFVPQTEGEPQAYLVRSYSEHATVGSHFHEHPQFQVFVEGAWWNVRTTGPALDDGATVRIVDVDGLHLIVEPCRGPTSATEMEIPKPRTDTP